MIRIMRGRSRINKNEPKLQGLINKYDLLINFFYLTETANMY
jgi:hypothetical protein